MFLVLIKRQNESGGTALQYNWDQPLDHSDHSYINVALNEQHDFNSTLTSVTLVSLTCYNLTLTNVRYFQQLMANPIMSYVQQVQASFE